jgi:hypothetical protein
VEGSNGDVRQVMGGAGVGMCVSLLEVKVKAADDNGRQAAKTM